MGTRMKHKRKLRSIERRKIGNVIKLAKEKLAFREMQQEIKQAIDDLCDQYFKGKPFAEVERETELLDLKFPEEHVIAEIRRNEKAATVWAAEQMLNADQAGLK